MRWKHFRPKSALLVIDLQNGFINEHTAHIPLRVGTLLDRHASAFSPIIFTQFKNTSDSIFARCLHWGGMTQPEEQALHPQVAAYAERYYTVEKAGYSALNRATDLLLKDPLVVYLVGVDTDACVLKTALDLFDRGIETYVLTRYVASSGGPDMHQHGLEILKRSIGEAYLLSDSF